jgi:hypothetical protein
MAYRKGLYVAATRQFEDTIAARPDLLADPRTNLRYSAARAAVLAGCGLGKDQPAPGDSAKAALRAKALDWLKADLAAWSKKLMDDQPAAGDPGVEKVLAQWRAEADLAGIRDAEALAKLPDGERAAFSSLWFEVEALRQKASRASGPTPPR